MSDINVGFIGLGNMGGGMCLNIIRNSYNVIVHDIDKEAALPALEMGASWAASPSGCSLSTRRKRAAGVVIVNS